MVNEDEGAYKLLQGEASPYNNLPNQPPDLLRSSEKRDVSTEEERQQLFPLEREMCNAMNRSETPNPIPGHLLMQKEKRRWQTQLCAKPCKILADRRFSKPARSHK